MTGKWWRRRRRRVRQRSDYVPSPALRSGRGGPIAKRWGVRVVQDWSRETLTRPPALALRRPPSPASKRGRGNKGRGRRRIRDLVLFPGCDLAVANGAAAVAADMVVSKVNS